MFAKFVIILLAVVLCYYAAVVLYDIYFTHDRKKRNEEVIIDISKVVEEYEPVDARNLVRKEEEQNKYMETGDGGEIERAMVAERSQELEEEEEIEEMDDEEKRYEELSESNEDYAPINTSYEYTPLEFKKMLEDAGGEKDLFASVFTEATYTEEKEEAYR